MPNRIKYIRAPGIPKTPIGEEPGDALPAVSSNDNGKVLGVVNGVWAVKSDSGASAAPVQSVNGRTGAVMVNEVPAVGGTDNKKVLTADNGTYSWEAVQSGETTKRISLYKNSQTGVYTCSMSATQLHEALPNVVLATEDYRVPVSAYSIYKDDSYVKAVFIDDRPENNAAIVWTLSAASASDLVAVTREECSIEGLPDYSHAIDGQVLTKTQYGPRWADNNPSSGAALRLLYDGAFGPDDPDLMLMGNVADAETGNAIATALYYGRIGSAVLVDVTNSNAEVIYDLLAVDYDAQTHVSTVTFARPEADCIRTATLSGSTKAAPVFDTIPLAGGGSADAVLYNTSQTLTDAQKEQARGNIDALASSELSGAINTALAQAKASGEFDGADGHSPFINTSGYWVFWNDSTGAWVTTNYKAAGTDGTDGHSPYIGQNGNWFAWDENLAMYDDTGVKAQGGSGDFVLLHADDERRVFNGTTPITGAQIYALAETGKAVFLWDEDGEFLYAFDTVHNGDVYFFMPAFDGNGFYATVVNENDNECSFSARPAIPRASAEDAGKVLTVDSNGAWTKQTPSGSANAVLYTPQSLTDAQKAQARTNVGAGTYSKPASGIPASDLASAVQTSLGKADTAVQPSAISGMATETYVQQQIAAIPDELPSVTASDNGKVLAVKNGEWSADSPVIVSGTDAQVANAVNDYLTQYGVPLRLSEEIKQALLDCFENVAWINDDGQTYYDALYDALYPPVDVLSISAVFTQGDAVIYDTDSLDDLKQYLVVTATMTDSTTRTLEDTDYTLSGTLTEGTSVITVYYGGKTTTFNVTVTHFSILPDAYQQVEYIANPSNAYMATNIEVPLGYTVRGKVLLSAKPNSAVNVCGSFNSDVHLNISYCCFSGITTNSAGTFYGNKNCFATISDLYASPLEFTTVHTANSISINLKNNGGENTNTVSVSAAETTALEVFRASHDAPNPFTGRIYLLEVLDTNNQATAKLIPCYRKADNVVGMYDIVGNAFYTSANSTAFTKGGDIA